MDEKATKRGKSGAEARAVETLARLRGDLGSFCAFGPGTGSRCGMRLSPEEPLRHLTGGLATQNRLFSAFLAFFRLSVGKVFSGRRCQKRETRQRRRLYSRFSPKT
jgi:hypothetical protein